MNDTRTRCEGHDPYGLDALHDPFSSGWYRAFKRAHLDCYPDLDQVSRDNLDALIATAERHEREAAA